VMSYSFAYSSVLGFWTLSLETGKSFNVH